ncbi:YbfB/YjiJ family MFS transporter [Oxalobacter sp. OttesenSCG-928-P03]|nr:YbfB/YjiJ family MFS transporter [Oxalobacter sp. OttesenSCG-928-P03]
MSTTTFTVYRPTRLEYIKVISAGLAALILTVGLARFSYTPLLTIMLRESALNDIQGGWLAALNYAGYLSGAMLSALSNNLRFKYTLYRLGLVTAVITTVAMGLCSNFTIWLILRYLSGVSSTAGLLIASGLVMNWLMRKGFKPSLGAHLMGIGLGIAVSGVAVACMSPYLGWEGQWVGLAVLGLFFFVPAWFYMPRPEVITMSSGRTAYPVPGKTWSAIFNTMYFCAGFGFVISATYIVTILEGSPAFEGRGSMVWIVVGAAAAPTSWLWDKVAGRFGETRTLIYAFLVQIVSIMLPVFSMSALAGYCSALLMSAWMGIVSLTLAIVGRAFPNDPARAMARLTLSYGVAQIVAPAITGYLVTDSGNYNSTLVITALIMGCGVLLLMVLGRLKTA